MKRIFIIASVLAGMMMFSCSNDDPQDPNPASPDTPESPQAPDQDPEENVVPVETKAFYPIDLTSSEKRGQQHQLFRLEHLRRYT